MEQRPTMMIKTRMAWIYKRGTLWLIDGNEGHRYLCHACNT